MENMNLNDVCLKRYIVNNSQPRIMYDTFCSFIFTINGKFYIQEDYQLGEIWSEEEIWGSTLYDLDNMKEMTAGVYVNPPGGWSKYLKHDDWWDDIYVDEKTTAKAIEYYKDIIIKNSKLKINKN